MSAQNTDRISQDLQHTIDHPEYYLTYNTGNIIVELILKTDIVLDERVARHCKETLEKLRPGHKYYLLVGSEGFFRLSKRARKLGASKIFSGHLNAVACYTSNSSLALLGELYNKINKPSVPTKVFASRETAFEWLNEEISRTEK